MNKDSMIININDNKEPLLTTAENKLEQKEAAKYRNIETEVKNQIVSFRRLHSIIKFKNPFTGDYSNLFNNPPDITTVIISFLPTESLLEFSVACKFAYKISADYLKSNSEKKLFEHKIHSSEILQAGGRAYQEMSDQKDMQNTVLISRDSKLSLYINSCAGGSVVGMLYTGIWLLADTSSRGWDGAMLPCFITFTGLCLCLCCGSCVVEKPEEDRQLQRDTECDRFSSLLGKLQRWQDRKVPKIDSKEYSFTKPGK